VGAPDHEPVLAVSVEPTAAVPTIVGGISAVGADAGDTSDVAADTATLEPAMFEAVTVTRSVVPMSASARR
jgi:hypothetical protein